MNPQDSHSAGSWRLHLFGDFGLFDPSGQRVHLPNRKVEGLLAVLAINRDYGVERQALADILWPDRAPTNLANLRQTLSLLRKSIGCDAVQGSRTNIRVLSAFPLTTDYERPENRTASAFMPGHEGGWFEDMRYGVIGNEGEIEESDFPTSSFQTLLEWYRERAPSKMYAMMRADSATLASLVTDRLRGFIAAVPDSAECSGWKAQWQGALAERSGPYPRAEHYYAVAARTAFTVGDHALMGESCLALCGLMILENKLKSAHRVADLCESYAMARKQPEVAGTAKIARALILLHSGERKPALAMLSEGEKYLGDDVAVAIRKGVRAFMASTCGMFSEAEALIRELDDAPNACGLPMREVCVALARASVDLAGRPGEEVRNDIDRLIQTFERLSYVGTLVYAHELNAELSSKLGDPARSRIDLAKSQALRRRVGMPYTEWDKMRLVRIGA